MKLELCSYKLAKLAKKKGFDWETECFYDKNKDLTEFMYFEAERNNSDGWSAEWEFDLTAPPLELLKKWFRDVHKVHISAFPVVTNRYYFTISKIKDDGLKKIINGPYDPRESSDTYEDALEQALTKAFELI